MKIRLDYILMLLLGALAWFVVNLIGNVQDQNRLQWQQYAKVESRISYLEGYHAAERCMRYGMPERREP